MIFIWFLLFSVKNPNLVGINFFNFYFNFSSIHAIDFVICTNSRGRKIVWICSLIYQSGPLRFKNSFNWHSKWSLFLLYINFLQWFLLILIFFFYIFSLGPLETIPREMVSRRKILSRSRDDLNLDQTYPPEEEEDVWYQKDKLFKVSGFIDRKVSLSFERFNWGLS